MKIIFLNRNRKLNHRRSPERQQKLPFVPVAVFGLSVLLSPQAAAVSVAAQGDPVKSGTGAALTGRWANVTTVGGASVDVFAEILSQSTTKTNDFWTDGDDMAFSFKDGVAGETREATVRYTFVDSVTNKPIKVTGLSLTIDDLDDGGGRHESLATSDATSYSLNNPTQVGGAISNSTISLTANGGNDLMPGDSEGAVQIDFTDASSFTITYRTVFSASIASSAYHLDGDSDFALSNPVSTPVPPSAPQLYFTYGFTNDNSPVKFEEAEDYEEATFEQRGYIKVAFFDSLPDGLVWDTTYKPFVAGPFPRFDVTYSNSNQDASFGIFAPPGDYCFTLRTKPTTLTGMITNDATITRSGYDPITAVTNITLAGPTLSTVVVDADVDTSIAQSAPTFNGYSTQLYATADNADPSQTMVYFDISDDVPAGATITSAAVYLTSTDPAGTNGAFALHEILPGVIWKGGTSFNWNVAGSGLQTDGTELAITPTDLSTVTSTIPGVSGTSDRKMWDITGLAQSWIANPTTNNGIAILASSPDRDIFCSSEHLSNSSRPKLVITYSAY